MDDHRPTAWTSDDWYRPGEGQLHFFQRQKVLLWVMGKSIYARAEAWGGELAVPGKRYPVMRPRLTTAGTYVVHECVPYVTKTWPLSRIPWGAPIKVDKGGEHLLYRRSSTHSAWQRLHFGSRKIALLREQFEIWYGGTGKYDADGDGFPDVWIFNDFGPWSIRYFVDSNRNRRREREEALMGEMIHTTPVNEVENGWDQPVQLSFSHGCIHVKPADRDRFHGLGAFKRGNLMVVHTPAEVVPDFLSRL